MKTEVELQKAMTDLTSKTVSISIEKMWKLDFKFREIMDKVREDNAIKEANSIREANKYIIR